MVLMLLRSTFYDLCFCWFLFSFLFLGLALHNIHAFHFRIVFVSSFQNLKKKEKRKKREGGGKEAKCVLHYFLGFEIKVGQFIFT